MGSRGPRRLLRRPLKPDPLPPISPTKSLDDADLEPPWPRHRGDTDSEDDEASSRPDSAHSAPDDPRPAHHLSYVTIDGERLPRINPLRRPAPPPVTRDDRKYVLDPALQRDTSLQGVLSLTQVQPYRPRGPAPLPRREPRHVPAAWAVHSTPADPPQQTRYNQQAEFTLESFLQHMSEVERIPLIKIKRIMYSRDTYQRITQLVHNFLLAEVSSQSQKLGKLKIELDRHYVIPRIPQRQLLIEMAALVKEQMKELLQTEVRTAIRPLPKYTPPHPPGEGPHTEILLFEDDREERRQRESRQRSTSEHPTKDTMFRASGTRYFMGANRSRSPFAEENTAGVITPAELAILDSLIAGGVALSLKAHFISDLPDITPLLQTLVYLNLSFNNFQTLPAEICRIETLEILKLRNNPLRELPAEINQLQKLRTLVVSFCLLSELPKQFYELHNLFHLDLSFNSFESLENGLANLSSLRELSLEGNRLCGMPAAAIRMKLRYLRVKNNYMHPLFWPDHLKNSPATLRELSSAALKEEVDDGNLDSLPRYMQKDISNFEACDCCRKPRYGPGFKVIRPCSKIFGIRNLPFVFRSCSSQCASDFMDMYETLSNFLYGSDRDELSGPETDLESVTAESEGVPAAAARILTAGQADTGDMPLGPGLADNGDMPLGPRQADTGDMPLGLEQADTGDMPLGPDKAEAEDKSLGAGEVDEANTMDVDSEDKTMEVERTDDLKPIEEVMNENLVQEVSGEGSGETVEMSSVEPGEVPREGDTTGGETGEVAETAGGEKSAVEGGTGGVDEPTGGGEMSSVEGEQQPMETDGRGD